jgi:hypothetical protein
MIERVYCMLCVCDRLTSFVPCHYRNLISECATDTVAVAPKSNYLVNEECYHSRKKPKLYS